MSACMTAVCVESWVAGWLGGKDSVRSRGAEMGGPELYPNGWPAALQDSSRRDTVARDCAFMKMLWQEGMRLYEDVMAGMRTAIERRDRN